MIAALTLFVVLTLSVIVIRTGAVALRLTGLPEGVARFGAVREQLERSGG